MELGLGVEVEDLRIGVEDLGVRVEYSCVNELSGGLGSQLNALSTSCRNIDASSFSSCSILCS